MLTRLVGRARSLAGLAWPPSTRTGIAPPPLAMPAGIDAHTTATIRAVAPYTLTSPERVAALVDAVRYVVRADLPGAIVECGVWRGGSMLAVAMTLIALGRTDRDLYLFDTFDAMPAPGPRDVDLTTGIPASIYHQQYVEMAREGRADPVYAYLPLDRVRELLAQTGYPTQRIHFVAGLVEDTVPVHAPERVALLRLDTDYYVSTRHELEHLLPRVPDGGILIVDDYGHYQGSRDATDEYLDRVGLPLLLQRLDYSGRLAVVTRSSVRAGT